MDNSTSSITVDIKSSPQYIGYHYFIIYITYRLSEKKFRYKIHVLLPVVQPVFAKKRNEAKFIIHGRKTNRTINSDFYVI